MLRKAIASIALAGALTLGVAGAASAATPAPYPAADGALECSAATVPTGTVFTCTVGGPEGAEATLTATFSGADVSVAGTTSWFKQIPASQYATFTVTAPANAGTIGFSAMVTPVEGQPYATNSTQVVVTVADSLATTGADNMGLALGAGALLVVGAGAVVVAARRRSAQNA